MSRSVRNYRKIYFLCFLVFYAEKQKPRSEQKERGDFCLFLNNSSNDFLDFLGRNIAQGKAFALLGKRGAKLE